MTKKTVEPTDPYRVVNILRTESKADLAKIFDDICQDVGPIDSYERIKVQDIVSHIWDKMRYRRIKNGLVQNALSAGLQTVLIRVMFPGPLSMSAMMFIKSRKAAEVAAHEWLFENGSKSQTLAVLAEAGFNESAIEAEAYKLVADDLANVDRMLDSADDALEKAYRSLAKYRKSLATHVRQNADRVLAEDVSPLLANNTVN